MAHYCPLGYFSLTLRLLHAAEAVSPASCSWMCAMQAIPVTWLHPMTVVYKPEGLFASASPFLHYIHSSTSCILQNEMINSHFRLCIHCDLWGFFFTFYQWLLSFFVSLTIYCCILSIIYIGYYCTYNGFETDRVTTTKLVLNNIVYLNIQYGNMVMLACELPVFSIFSQSWFQFLVLRIHAG